MLLNTKILNISGMSCGSCVGKVERVLQEFNGVEKVSVDLENKKAKIKFSTDNVPSNEELINRIEKAGFRASINN